MPAPEVHHLFHAPIADHSFSADRSTLAVARDNNVELYHRSGNAFKLQDELRGHDKTITGVDIAPRSGRIVTCSQDRNAYVWEPSQNGEWKPTLVLLRINRAATGVRWCPNETKFAVGSGARIIAVCYFEEENDCVLLAAGSTDGHARVFSSFVKGIDERPEPCVWGERLPFNTVCGEYLNPTAGWVHDVAFSPSGDALAFCSHDSSVTIVYPSGPEQPPQAVISIATQLLPFASLLWSSETEVVAAGYDCGVYRLSGDANGWQLTGSLEEKKERPGMPEQREESALNMFRSMDLKGRSGGAAMDDTKLKTVHQNSINTVRAFQESGGQIRKISTGGVDGRVVVWDV
ncbi:ARP2/3 actin-organizing complex subunit Sop2 [Friedmanniomyces endolithicus]|nr:ARP2/3 actin-organizing complex subunit Sop2 [Friedmanniomyces endolithicus]KAK0994940.1 ARP2/3 actin-organizing complex subunit Sop2 [Friedmanniomyces endolithicus]